MSKSSFLSVERTFNLPPEVLPILETRGGREHCNLGFPNEKDNRHIQSIGERPMARTFLVADQYS